MLGDLVIADRFCRQVLAESGWELDRQLQLPALHPGFELLSRPDGGLLGEVSRLLSSAAEDAIRDGTEQVTLSLLEQAAHALA